MGNLHYDDYQSQRHMRPLDGVRALAIIFVVSSHMPETWWQALNGYAGVTWFFCLSGFLITTLALREEDRRGRLSLRGFYIRRAFRIFPVYYLVLAVYVVLVESGFHGGADQFRHNLPYYLTYLNELTPEGPYHQTWSLGIEEKFYLVWPLLAFVLMLKLPRWRPAITVGLLAVIVVVNRAGVVGYDLGLYAPILMGCILALVLHRRDYYTAAVRAVRPPLILAAVAVAVALHALLDQVTFIGLLYAAVIAAIMGAALISRGVLHRFLSWRSWRWIAERSYSVYLIHQLAEHVASLPFGTQGDLTPPLAVLRFVATLAVSLAMAEVLWRLVERPLIRLGHRLSRRYQTPTTAPAAAVA